MTKLFTFILCALYSPLLNAQISISASTNTVKPSDTVKYVIFGNRFLSNEPTAEQRLTKNEINLVLKLIKNKIKKSGLKEYDFDSYKLQFIVSIKNNHKIVFINGFCEAFVDWHKQFVFVNDGGSCYFSAEVNLKAKKANIFSI